MKPRARSRLAAPLAPGSPPSPSANHAPESRLSGSGGAGGALARRARGSRSSRDGGVVSACEPWRTRSVGSATGPDLASATPTGIATRSLAVGSAGAATTAAAGAPGATTGAASTLAAGAAAAAGTGTPTAGVPVGPRRALLDDADPSSSTGTAPPPRSTSASLVAVTKRSSGDLASSRATTVSSHAGTSGRRLATRGAISLTWRVSTSNTRPPTNGGSPVSISIAMQPSEYRSARRSVGSPLACSGDM